MNRLLASILLVFCLILSLGASTVVRAVEPTTTPIVTEEAAAPTSRTVTLVNPLGTESIPELVGNIIKTAVGVVGAFALLIFVYGGFLLLTSGGETAKIQAGKDAMKWSAIGIVVVFSSYTLVKFVLSSLSK